MPATAEKVYRDLDFMLTPHPSTGEVMTRKNSEAVKQAIRLLVLTSPYERLFRPGIGGGVRDFLFSNAGPLTEDLVQERISETIDQFEPRAELLDVAVVSEEDRNLLQIRIFFRVLGRTDPETLDVVLTRVR